MQVTQLNPSIPLDTIKGPGVALFMTWLSEENNLFWTVAIDETGEIWTLDNTQVRAQKNIMMNRIIDNSYLKKHKLPNTNQQVTK